MEVKIINIIHETTDKRIFNIIYIIPNFNISFDVQIEIIFF